MTKVTFITVCYRTPDLIRLLLKGVEAAKFAFPFEYVLVNNASGDGTSEMVRERFPWVTVVDAPSNVGHGAGNNIGIRQASGEYVMLLNPDIVVFPGQMERLLEEADRMPQAAIIGPKLVNPDRSLQRSFCHFPRLVTPLYRRTWIGRTPWGRRDLKRYFMADKDASCALEASWLIGGALLLRSSALQRIGESDERFFMYFEDVDLCRRAWEEGFTVAYVPSASFVHYHHRESDVRFLRQVFMNRATREHIASAIRYFWKYRGKPIPSKCPR